MTDHRPSPRSLVIGAVGTALVVAASRRAAKRFITPDPIETRFLTPWELGIEYEDVVFQTGDGLEISGWWLGHPGAKRTIITLAGHNSARHHVLGISSALHRAGANVLLFDNRGRGSSEGDKISLGHYERLDASAAVEYAMRRGPSLPLGMMGFSMGGAVAIMAAARDERIKAIVADSPFASQARLITYHLRSHVGPLAPAIFHLAKGALHYDIHEVEPGKDVGKYPPAPSCSSTANSTPLPTQRTLSRCTKPPEGRKNCGSSRERATWIRTSKTGRNTRSASPRFSRSRFAPGEIVRS